MLEVSAAETPPSHPQTGLLWAPEAGGVSVALKIESGTLPPLCQKVSQAGSGPRRGEVLLPRAL